MNPKKLRTINSVIIVKTEVIKIASVFYYLNEILLRKLKTA